MTVFIQFQEMWIYSKILLDVSVFSWSSTMMHSDERSPTLIMSPEHVDTSKKDVLTNGNPFFSYGLSNGHWSQEKAPHDGEFLYLWKSSTVIYRLNFHFVVSILRLKLYSWSSMWKGNAILKLHLQNDSVNINTLKTVFSVSQEGNTPNPRINMFCSLSQNYQHF